MTAGSASRRNDRAGLGDWTVSTTGLAARAASPGRQGDRARHAVRSLVRAGDGQPGLGGSARPSGLDHGHRDRLPVESRHQQVINLGIPECYAYIRDAIFDILAEYKISYIKWDHNRDLIDAGSPPDGRPGVHAQTLAFYRLVDEIKAAHPGLEIESCSSGGARVDLGVLERTDRIWVSDCIDPVERQQMNRWTSQLLPPELLGSHIASPRSHTTGRVNELSFRAATAIFGHLGIEWDLTAATTQRTRRTRRVDQLLQSQPKTADARRPGPHRLPRPHPLCVYGIIAPDRSTAIYTVASIGQSEVMLPGRLRFPGLDPRPPLPHPPHPARDARRRLEPTTLVAGHNHTRVRVSRRTQPTAGECPPTAATGLDTPRRQR